MINFPVIIGGFTPGIEQALFMDLQSGLAALAKLQKDQGYGAAFFVADKIQLLGFQLICCAAGDQL